MIKFSPNSSLPLVSAVIPTRNRPELVVRAVRSALAQTYPNLEVVVIIDGPDRSTVEALSDIYDDRLRFFELSNSVGGAQARNEGVRRSCGEWIGFLDDDDEWLPDKIWKQIEIANRLGKEFIICSRMIVISPNTNDVWPKRFPKNGESISEYLLNRTRFFKGEAQIQTSSFLISKDIFDRVKFRSGLKKHQDLDLYLRAANLDGIKFFFDENILSKWYIEQSIPTVSQNKDWRYTLDWASENSHLFEGSSLSGFLASQASTEIPPESISIALRLYIPIMMRNNARPIDYAILFLILLIRGEYRRKVSGFIRNIPKRNYASL
ncbi:glycosyltransferase family 2 protein [Deinococcus daejeonensis]|uniref:Glycosyltransferase 2-like domain-containing protein n=1 Tax=Deinococcus daejeonensis TaxID=1007098 RepID=A0ABQ2J290_9DEIO|nr:glycosyltransferase family 2 protein [Deinococcus daejeonensis]GGN38154.1 hypothetical protein GCM10010842_20760 [Deinococcus daejeonensis]